MNLPKIQNNQIFVLRGERSSGIILNNDSSYYLNEGDNYYEIFSNIEDAKKYINSIITESIEFSLFDSQGTFLEMIVI